MSHDILDDARSQVLHEGRGLAEDQVARCLSLPEDRLGEALSLAHEVRLRWCGPAVEVEGIVSVKTGGCPEDCHFCSQSGQFSSPVRPVWLDIAELVAAARATAATGATEFCIVAAVRGPDERLMSQVGRRGPGDHRRGRASMSPARWGFSPRPRRANWPASACTVTTTTWKPRGPSSARW